MITVGIDIGKFSVKIAEVELTSKGYILHNAGEFPLSTDPTKDQRLEVVDILRQLITRYDLHSTKFVMGVPQEKVTMRRLFFPFRERHKILKSLPFELEDDIPLSQDDAVFDAKITRFINDKSEVMAVACPKTAVADLCQLARDGHVDVEMISVEGAALANLLEDITQPPSDFNEKEDLDQQPAMVMKASALLDIGHSSSHLVVSTQGRLCAVRTVDWGGRDLAQAVAKNYSLHYVEALKEMRHKGHIVLTGEEATKDQNALSQILKASIDDFCHELKLILLDVETDQKLMISSLHLIGGVSQLPNLAPYMTQKLEINCNRLKKLAHHPQLNYEALNFKENVTSVAIALALEGIKKPKNPAINLMRGEFARQSQTVKLFFNKWGHTLKVATAAFIVLIAFGMIRDNLAQNMADQADLVLREQARKVAHLARHRSGPRYVRKYIKEQERLQKTRKLAESLQDVNSALDIIKKIAISAPDQRQLGINILDLSIDNDAVKISGEIKNRAELPRFKSALAKVSEGGQIRELPGPPSLTPGWQAFAFQIKVNRHSGG